ncbi:MAG: hypothetical protein H7Z21_08435 [Hymenobacter sp.]|nr:hypothetical protein [Hymenobacter sp.]
MNRLKQFWEPGLGRTVLFSVAVVSFVIGAYQTVLQNDENALSDNYWLFMISFVCVLLFRYLKPKADGKPAAKSPARPPGAGGRAVPRNKRRG